MLSHLTVVDAATQIAGGDHLFANQALAFDDACRRRGVSLTFQTDMHLFRSTFLGLGDPRAHLSPLLDAAWSDLRLARWFLGRDARGRTVATQAFRLYPDDGTTSYDRWCDLRMYYDHPEEREDEICVVVDEAVGVNRELRCWLSSGGTWVHPDLRGPDEEGFHLSQLLPRLSRLIGMRMFPQAEATTAGIRPKLAGAGVADRYGYRNIEPMIIHTQQGSPADFLFLWMPRGEVEADALHFHERLTAGRYSRAAE
jgi:hypothetical protein